MLKSVQNTDVLPLVSLNRSSTPLQQEAWARVVRRLRAEVGEDVFTSWFGRLELDGILDDCAHLSVPTKFLKSWIQSHYTDRLLNLLHAELPEIIRLIVGVRTSSRQPPARLPRQDAMTNRGEATNGGFGERAPSTFVGEEGRHAPAHPPQELQARPIARDSENDPLAGSPLDRRFSFKNFIVGRSNQLAHAAAQRIATASPGESLIYNPLYVHATVGMGKTHLVQAIAHEAGAARRRVIYLTAEKFMYGFVSALKAQTAIAFKEKLRAIDLLVIDDVQFLQGKSIQQEFCHTLNALIDARRQIVIAADRPPADLESLDERVRSRLAGGLCVEMSCLDEALRVKILEARITAVKVVNPGFEVPAAVVSYVASVIQTNGRDLDGAVNRLLAHVSLNNTPLSVETAEIAVRDLVRTREPKRVKIEDIQKLVATRYSVTRADILSSRRTANVVRPRQIAMYLSKVLTLRSLPEIGRRFGGRDHTTVLHAVRKIENLAGADGTLSEEIELLKRMLLD